MTEISDEELLDECRERGLLPRPRDKNESLRNIWEQTHSLVRMMADLVHEGAVLTINHPAFFAATADMKLLVRSAFMSNLDAILKNAVVSMEPREEGERHAAE